MNASALNIVIATVLEAPLTRTFLRAVFYYPFLQLKLPRVTAFIDRTNTRSLHIAKRIGFEVEGILREAAPDGDVVVLGLLKRNCRWVPQ